MLKPGTAAKLAPVLGAAAMVLATMFVFVLTPGIQVLENGEATDLVFALLVITPPVGVAIGFALE